MDNSSLLVNSKKFLVLLAVWTFLFGYLQVYRLTNRISEKIVASHNINRFDEYFSSAARGSVDHDDGLVEELALTSVEEQEGGRNNPIPTVIIAGTQKGGTDALRFYLGSHPQMLASKVQEPHFFDRKCGSVCDLAVKDPSNKDIIDRARTQYASNWRVWYHPDRRNSKSYSNSNSKSKEKKPSLSMRSKEYTFEKSPRYLFHPYVPAKVKAVVPWTKIIVLLRDPVERMYSQFKMNYGRKILNIKSIKKKLKAKEYGDVSFETCIDIDMQKLKEAGILKNDDDGDDDDGDDFWDVDDDEKEKRWLKYWEIWDEEFLTTEVVCDGEIGRGLYYLQLLRWFREYNTAEDREKIFLTTSESLLPDRETKMVDVKPITDFIGIDEMEIVAEKKIHATSSDLGPMKDVTRQRLEQLFDPFNKKLGSLLGKEWDDPWPYDSISR